MKQELIGNEIVKVATRFVNLYEIKSNAEWRFILDPSKGKEESNELHKAMVLAGWRDGLPYCAAFVEAIWRLAYTEVQAPNTLITSFSKSLNPSVMSSYNNFKTQITKTPMTGSIFFMQNGTGWSGHAGIVIGCDGKNIATIEGNTSSGKAISIEADRNGDGIFKKVRTLDFSKKSRGLHLLGFLNPIAW